MLQAGLQQDPRIAGVRATERSPVHTEPPPNSGGLQREPGSSFPWVKKTPQTGTNITACWQGRGRGGMTCPTSRAHRLHRGSSRKPCLTQAKANPHSSTPGLFEPTEGQTHPPTSRKLTPLQPGEPQASHRPGPTSPGPQTCCAAFAEPAGTSGSATRADLPPPRVPLLPARHFHTSGANQGRARRQAPPRASRDGGEAALPSLILGSTVRAPGVAAGTRVHPGTRVARRGHGPPPGLGTFRVHRRRWWCWGPQPAPGGCLWHRGEQRGTPRGCSICSQEGTPLWVPWGQPAVDTPPQSGTWGSDRPQGYNEPHQGWGHGVQGAAGRVGRGHPAQAQATEPPVDIKLSLLHRYRVKNRQNLNHKVYIFHRSNIQYT